MPTGELRIGWMSVHEDPCGSFAVAVAFLKHCELIGKHGFVLMNRRLDVPAGQIPAIGARESSGATATDRGALPVAVVDVDVVLAYARMIEWLAERAAPVFGISSPRQLNGAAAHKTNAKAMNRGRCFFIGSATAAFFRLFRRCA